MSELSLRATLISAREPLGRDVRATLGETGLTLQGAQAAQGSAETLVVPYARIEIDRRRAAELRLCFGSGAERCELVVVGRETLAALREKAPPALAERLVTAGDAPAVRGPGRTVMMIASGVLALAVAGLLGLVLLPAPALVALTPWPLEASAGELLTATILADSGGAEQGDAARTLDALGDRLAQLADAPHPIAFHLLASPDPDLIAVPGGNVIVSTGAITSAAGARELIRDLARALVHAARRHTLAQTYDQIGRLAMLSLLLGGLPEFGESLPRTARRVGDLTYSSAQEEEAERVAQTLVAQLDAQALDRDWEQLRAAARAAQERDEGELDVTPDRR